MKLYSPKQTPGELREGEKKYCHISMISKIHAVRIKD